MVDEIPFLGIAYACFSIATIAYFVYLVRGDQEIGRAGTWTNLLGAVILIGGLVVRAVRAGRCLPVGIYELSLTLTFCMVSLYLLLEHLTRIGGERRRIARGAGAFVMPLVLLVHTYALLILPPTARVAEPLAPVLRSPWFGLYILGVLIAYGFFAVACGAGLMCLYANVAPTGEDAGIFPPLEVIDRLNYRAVGYGFPWLTAGLAAGSWWAWRAWGSYWHGSSAEIWILVPWLIYAASLHLRKSGRWSALHSALFSVLGFVVVLLTFLGGYVLTGKPDVISSLPIY
jgi:ABC-type transport system involved in cytochrome c biogenesis permease subunit